MRLSVNDGEQIADLYVFVEVVPQREVLVDLVVVTSTVTLPGEVAGPLELADDAMGRPLGYPDARGDVPQAHVRVAGHAQEHVGVIGQKPPTGHK